MVSKHFWCFLEAQKATNESSGAPVGCEEVLLGWRFGATRRQRKCAKNRSRSQRVIGKPHRINTRPWEKPQAWHQSSQRSFSAFDRCGWVFTGGVPSQSMTVACRGLLTSTFQQCRPFSFCLSLLGLGLQLKVNRPSKKWFLMGFLWATADFRWVRGRQPQGWPQRSKPIPSPLGLRYFVSLGWTRRRKWLPRSMIPTLPKLKSPNPSNRKLSLHREPHPSAPTPSDGWDPALARRLGTRGGEFLGPGGLCKGLGCWFAAFVWCLFASKLFGNRLS